MPVSYELALPDYLLRKQGRLGAAGGGELFHDSTDVYLHRRFFDLQFPGDDFVRLPPPEPLENPLFARRQSAIPYLLAFRTLRSPAMHGGVDYQVVRYETAAPVVGEQLVTCTNRSVSSKMSGSRLDGKYARTPMYRASSTALQSSRL
jgi:hypothetical protein